MSYLTDHQIAYLGEDLVKPFRRENVQPASIDLCLSYTVAVPIKPRGADAVMDMNDPPKSWDMVNIGLHGFVLHPGEFVLGGTEEAVTLPDNIVGKIVGKSGLERFGLICNLSAGWIDPGFRGRLTFGMFNALRVPIVLRPGKKCCQVAFAFTSTPAKHLYDGFYQDSEGVVTNRGVE